MYVQCLALCRHVCWADRGNAKRRKSWQILIIVCTKVLLHVLARLFAG